MTDDTRAQNAPTSEVRVFDGKPIPGLVLVSSAGEPMLEPLPLVNGMLQLGRGAVQGLAIDDSCMSRLHARVSYNGSVWTVTDSGSRNGTWLNGERRPEWVSESPGLLRLGDSLFLFTSDIRRYPSSSVEVGTVVTGPTLRRVWNVIRAAARDGDTLHITGESGSGKELAARAFHENSQHARGPFIAVNCAAIPEGVAERLLFGARRGAYSGATETTQGYVQSADGGTLFLDEVGELDLAVQAKLLRVLETREVLALGDTTPRRVTLSLCSATHKDLRSCVAEKRFREDLYFRLGRPHVQLPPLRERREEIPFLIRAELARSNPRLKVEVSFVETCMLRPWPGNVRELLVEVRDAARRAVADESAAVAAVHLAATAGTKMESTSNAAPSGQDNHSFHAPAPLPDREIIEATLRREKGGVSSTARALGIHRNQLRRWLAKHGVDPRKFGAEGAEGAEGEEEPDEAADKPPKAP